MCGAKCVDASAVKKTHTQTRQRRYQAVSLCTYCTDNRTQTTSLALSFNCLCCPTSCLSFPLCRMTRGFICLFVTSSLCDLLL